MIHHYSNLDFLSIIIHGENTKRKAGWIIILVPRNNGAVPKEEFCHRDTEDTEKKREKAIKFCLNGLTFL